MYYKIINKYIYMLIKNRILLISAALAMIASCNTGINDPIAIEFPTPTESITKVMLSETEQGYVNSGNDMSLKLFVKLYDGSNLVCSPLSIQFALAMTANGASGETLSEITDFLGYGKDGIAALNAYCNSLLKQLPAVDLDVKLKLVDALIVNSDFPLLASFKETVEKSYYAAVDNRSFNSPSEVAALINDWTKRSTEGFIDKVLFADDISKDAVAFIMNALYFKAKWAGSEHDPMFREERTKEEDFTLTDGSKVRIPMMNNSSYHKYAEMDGFKVLALPYASRKYYMYILLPEKNDLAGLVKKLPDITWKDILSNLKQDARVNVKLPRFDIENKFNLNEPLKSLGVRKIFSSGKADFSNMFADKIKQYWIDKVFQKARISVAEWGTEAAAVTVVAVDGATSAGPGDEPKRVNFYADHPFLFLIGESTSGTILFIGAYTGE